MNPTAVASPPERLSESQRTALMRLLGDDDPAVHTAVRARLIACGPVARDWLRPHLLSSDPVVRRHAQEIVLHFGRQTADNRFLAFCLRQGENLDLEQGVWLLAQTRYPDANVEAYQALLDQFAGELQLRLVFTRGARAILETINHYLFDELGFAGNEKHYQDPDNSYLNRVLDRRRGIPITLCLVYMLLGRRLRLPITGIGLPGHFVCRLQTSAEEVYVDCFNRGRLLSKADCVHFLLSGNYDLSSEYLAPLQPRRALMRLCGNLHRIHYHRNAGEEVTRFQRYLVALAR